MHSMPSGYNTFGKNKQLTTTDLMKSFVACAMIGIPQKRSPKQIQVPARSILKICCKMNLIFPSPSGLQHYAVAIFAWPLFLNMALSFEKRNRAMFEFQNCSLTLVKSLIVPLDARWRFPITESFLKGAHERHFWEHHPLQNLKNLK